MEKHSLKKVTNPLKEIREKNNLSQKAFASLAGVSEQVVIRNELGMFRDINPSILQTCLSVDTIHEEALKDRYELYILSELANVKLPYIPERGSLDTIEGMKEFRKALTEANDMSDSNYSMCKLLKLHLYPIERYMKGRKDTAPIHVYERIEEIAALRDVLTKADNVEGPRT